MGVLLIAATSLGAREVARWQYLNDTFDSEWGLGLTAAVTALMVAVAGPYFGNVMDRRDPRPFVVLATSIAALIMAVTGLTIILGGVPQWLALVAAAADGIALAMGSIAFLKTQVSFVRAGAEGATEIVNILRLGIGGVVGALIAGAMPNPQTTLIAMAVLISVGNVFVWKIMRPVVMRPAPAVSDLNPGAFRAYLQSSDSPRSMLVIDLLLAVIIPTQLVNLILVNLDLPELASLSIAAGMLGVLAGRVLLTVLGFRGNPRLLLSISILGLAITQLVGAVALQDNWLVRQALLLPAIVIIGSLMSTYAQGLTAAIIQQQVSDAYRGRFSSIVVAGRFVLISVGALLGTFIAVYWDSQVLLTVLGLSLVVLTIGTRAYRVVPTQ
jgi:MFS family permease